MIRALQIRTAAAGAFRALRLGVLVGALLGAAPAVAAFSGGPVGPNARSSPEPRPGALALAPLDDRQGDRSAAAAAEAAVRDELEAAYDLVAPERLRDAQRRGRIRSVDDATVDELAGLGRETGAGRIVTVTLHQAVRRTVPRIALSARAYDAATGTLVWAGFESTSGLDGRTVLGLGVIDDLDELAARSARRLMGDYLDAVGGRAPRRAIRNRRSAGAERFGRVAVIPLGAAADRAGTNAAETATEALRAVLFRAGFDLASPVHTAEALRELRFTGWGGIDAPSRLALGRALGVDHLITGSVESFEMGGGEEEPEPRVALGLRLLDAATGRIVWTGGGERRGWDAQGPFRTGRTYARGDLAERMIRTAVERLLRSASDHEIQTDQIQTGGSAEPDDPDLRGTRS